MTHQAMTQKYTDNKLTETEFNLKGNHNYQYKDYLKLNEIKMLVKRAKHRANNGGKSKPRIIAKAERNTEESIVETKDANKLKSLRKALTNANINVINTKIKKYLDKHLPNWNKIDDLEYARQIVMRINERFGMPRHVAKEKQTTPELVQESKDNRKLNYWKQALRGKIRGNCPQQVREYLDENLPLWRQTKLPMHDTKHSGPEEQGEQGEQTEEQGEQEEEQGEAQGEEQTEEQTDEQEQEEQEQDELVNILTLFVKTLRRTIKREIKRKIRIETKRNTLRR